MHGQIFEYLPIGSRRTPMNLIRTTLILIGFSLLAVTANAQIVADPPSQKTALEIISLHERIKPGFYKIIRITPGKRQDKQGFIQPNIIRVTAFAPQNAGRPTRTIKHFFMQYSPDYGWFLESQKQDSRGIYLEITSERRGRVILR